MQASGNRVDYGTTSEVARSLPKYLQHSRANAPQLCEHIANRPLASSRYSGVFNALLHKVEVVLCLEECRMLLIDELAQNVHRLLVQGHDLQWHLQ